jgi:arabinogalactan oligomer / maltooligosaccharide transport system permease protein
MKERRTAISPLFSRAALSYIALFAFTLFALYPITRIITIGLRPGDQLLSTSLAFIPAGATLANFRVLLTSTPFLRCLVNSTAIALAVTLTGIALASTAGYALSRFRFSGWSSMLNGLLVTQMFPATMLLLPLYLILIKLSLINSYIGVVIIYSATALPFCIWQLKGYYDTIPLALEESAGIDGCTRWQSFYLVVLPLAAPALVITALFSFMTAWNEYVVVALMLQDVEKFTLPHFHERFVDPVRS